MLSAARFLARGLDPRARAARCETSEHESDVQIRPEAQAPAPGGMMMAPDGEPSLQEATAALQSQVDHLKTLLNEKVALDREAQRVQRALERQAPPARPLSLY